MARLAQTEGLTEDQQRDPGAPSTSSWRRRSSRSRRSSSTPTSTRPTIVEGMKEMGIFGLMIPEEYGGLGESLLTYALCVEEIARGWMSGQRHHQHALHRRLHADAARHRGAEGATSCRGWRRRDPRARSRCRSRTAGQRRRGDQVQGRARRRRLRPQRPEDVAHQRRHLHAGRGAGAHRRRGRGGRERLQEDDDVPDREARRVRRGPPGPDHPREDRQDGLQGRRHHRAGDGRPAPPGRPRSWAASPARASTR